MASFFKTRQQYWLSEQFYLSKAKSIDIDYFLPLFQYLFTEAFTAKFIVEILNDCIWAAYLTAHKLIPWERGKENPCRYHVTFLLYLLSSSNYKSGMVCAMSTKSSWPHFLNELLSHGDNSKKQVDKGRYLRYLFAVVSPSILQSSLPQFRKMYHVQRQIRKTG